jgi:hypothetical protein
MNAILNLIKPSPAPETAHARLGVQQTIIKEAIAEDTALIPKTHAYQAEVQEANAAGAIVAALRDRWVEVLAAEELGDAPPEPRAPLEKLLEAAVAKATTLQQRGAVATAGLAQLAKKRELIAQRRVAAERQIPELLHQALHDRLAAQAAAFDQAVKEFAAAAVEVFAIAKARDLVGEVIPGAEKSGGERIFELALPIPNHSAFKAVRRDVAKEVAERADEILAELRT